MADFLEEKRREIQQRLKELKPLADEYHRLEAAEQALAGVGGDGGGARARGPRRGAGGARAAPTARAAGPPEGLRHARRSRRSSSCGRKPGITIPELAEAMGIKQNYLYRVMPTLAEEGQIVKSGRGWHVKDKETA